MLLLGSPCVLVFGGDGGGGGGLSGRGVHGAGEGGGSPQQQRPGGPGEAQRPHTQGHRHVFSCLSVLTLDTAEGRLPPTS